MSFLPERAAPKVSGKKRVEVPHQSEWNFMRGEGLAAPQVRLHCGEVLLVEAAYLRRTDFGCCSH